MLCILTPALAVNQVVKQTVINQTVSLFISKAPLLSRQVSQALRAHPFTVDSFPD